MQFCFAETTKEKNSAFRKNHCVLALLLFFALLLSCTLLVVLIIIVGKRQGRKMWGGVGGGWKMITTWPAPRPAPILFRKESTQLN
jgi:hypothetical protein